MPRKKQSESYDRLCILFGKETGEANDLELLAKEKGERSRGILARKVLRQYLRDNRELIESLRSLECV